MPSVGGVGQTCCTLFPSTHFLPLPRSLPFLRAVPLSLTPVPRLHFYFTSFYFCLTNWPLTGFSMSASWQSFNIWPPAIFQPQGAAAPTSLPSQWLLHMPAIKRPEMAAHPRSPLPRLLFFSLPSRSTSPLTGRFFSYRSAGRPTLIGKLCLQHPH